MQFENEKATFCLVPEHQAGCGPVRLVLIGRHLLAPGLLQCPSPGDTVTGSSLEGRQSDLCRHLLDPREASSHQRQSRLPVSV